MSSRFFPKHWSIFKNLKKKKKEELLEYFRLYILESSNDRNLYNKVPISRKYYILFEILQFLMMKFFQVLFWKVIKMDIENCSTFYVEKGNKLQEIY